MSIINGICDNCGSDRLGSMCSCGEIRCICEGNNCTRCEQDREFENQQQMYENEKYEREDFEIEMDRKYH